MMGFGETDSGTGFAMKNPLLIALAAAIVLSMGSGLAAMNRECKMSHDHTWCASHYSLVRQSKNKNSSSHFAPLQL
jgi:hypothetical protein